MNYDLAALGLSSDAIQDEGTASSPLEEPVSLYYIHYYSLVLGNNN